jgi:PAS domain-containing protein
MSDSIAHPVEADPGYPGALLVEAVNRLSLGLIIFDKKREIVFCNQRYLEIYGLTPEQVKPGTPISEMIRHRLAMGLKVLQKPDEYIRERIGSPVVATTTVQEFADGRVIAYTAYPMPDGGGLATHEDITEREAMIARLKQQQDGPSADHEEALKIRNLQFDMAINNMSQGLCFFDAAHRLIVCNQRYIEMYDLPPDRVTPGMLLSEIVDMRFEAGSFPAMSREEYLHWRTKVAVSADPTARC